MKWGEIMDREFLINKLKQEKEKFLNSPTADLMREMNDKYENNSELPLNFTLSEIIDEGREDRL